MTIQQTHEADTFKRVKNFAADHAADFPADTVADQQFTKVAAAAPQTNPQPADQRSAKGERARATLTKAQIHPLLYDQLKTINENAHTLADLGTTGLEAKFRMPRSGGHGALLTAARQFKKDASEFEGQFIGLNLPADFIDTLGQTITDFESATDDQTGGLEDQAGQTTGLAQTHAAARKALRIVNTIVRNTYKNNAVLLAEWAVASHIETTKAHHTPKPTPAPQPPNP